MSHRRTAFRRFGSLLIAVLALLAICDSPASAAGTNTVVSSNPAAGENVAVPPTQLQIIFNEEIPALAAISGIGIAMTCEGISVGLGPVQLGVDRRTVSTALTQLPGTGDCAVSWSLPDGSAGAIQFVIAGGSSDSSTTTTLAGEDTTTTTTPTETVVTEGNPPRVGGPLGLVRLLSYIAIAALFAGLVLLPLSWPEGISDAAAARFFKIVWPLASLITVLNMILAAAQHNGKSFTESLSLSDWTDLASDTPGRALVARTVLVVLAGWMAWQPTRVIDPATDSPALLHLILIAASFGFDRSDGRSVVLGYPIGVVHAMSALFVVGGAIMFSRVLLTGKSTEATTNALREYSKWTLRALVIVVVTGVLQTFRLDGFGILTSPHGRVILTKIVFVAVGIFILLALRKYIMTALSRVSRLNSTQALRARHAMNLSVAFFAVALAFTSWSVTMLPAQMPKDSEAAKKLKFAWTERLTNEDFDVQISLDPATTGRNKLRIELYAPSRINTFHVKFVPALASASGIDLGIPLERPGTAIVTIDGGLRFDTEGVWSIELTGTTTTGDLTPLVTTIDLSAPPPSTTTTLPGQTTTSTTSTSTTTTTTTLPVFTLPN
jgi:uncharacterized membrane protein